MNTNSKLSRRSFITGTAAVGALSALGLSACSGESKSKDSGGASTADAASNAANDWAKSLNVDIASVLPGNTSEKVEVGDTKECDIVVLGAGCSGTNTAVRASELGKKVILVEKTSTVGGASNLSGSAMAYGSSYATAAGAEYNLLDIMGTWVADSHWRVDGASINQLLNKCGEAVDWMSANGWEFTTSTLNAASVNLPDYSVRQGLYLDMINAHVVKNGGELLTETTAKSLITDENGAVTGAIVVDKNGTGIQINAKAVVIATGGYAGNREMVNEVFRFDGVLGGVPQNIGEGLEMAWKAGAQKPQNFGGQMLHQTLARATDVLSDDYEGLQWKYPMILCYIAGVPNVGATGLRFRNEEYVLSPHAAANSSAYQGSFHYVVISQKIMNIIEEQGLAGLGNLTRLPGLPGAYRVTYELTDPWVGLTEVLDTMVEKGAGFRADTFEELAKAADMNPDIFVKQMKDYESYCASGVDEQFGKASRYLMSLGEGPYYIITSEVNSLGSWGGILTNTDYQALDYNRIPVEGLYAVGSEAGSGLYNDTYVGSGIAMANTITSGYLCGSKLGKQ